MIATSDSLAAHESRRWKSSTRLSWRRAYGNDAESAGSDSKREDGAVVGGFESYTLLPSSPVNSDEGDGPFPGDEGLIQNATSTAEQNVDAPTALAAWQDHKLANAKYKKIATRY